MNIYSSIHIQLLKVFTDHGVKFLLIGGHAAIYYGVMRNTGDLDLLIEPTAANGQRVIDAFRSYGLEVPEMDVHEFEKDLVLSFGFEPDAVDIINFTPGIEFNTAFGNARIIDFNTMEIRIMDIKDLIKNKESLSRTGEKSLLDKYDVEVLKKILNNRKNL